jgi:hypothetical protein
MKKSLRSYWIKMTRKVKMRSQEIARVLRAYSSTRTVRMPQRRKETASLRRINKRKKMKTTTSTRKKCLISQRGASSRLQTPYLRLESL